MVVSFGCKGQRGGVGLVPWGYSGRVGARPDLHAAFKKFADQAGVVDTTGGGAGFEGGQQGLGQAHVDAGGFGGGFPGEGAELGEVEGGEVLGEEGFGLGVSGHYGDGFHSGEPRGGACHRIEP